MIWIFDLDNTLFDASRHVFPWMKKAMESYLQSRLGLSLTEAQMLRSQYRRQYGSTMAGLLRQHAIDPYDFINSIHPVAELPRLVPANPHIKAVLTSLPGKNLFIPTQPVSIPKKYCASLALAAVFKIYSPLKTPILRQNLIVEPSKKC